MKYLRIMKTLTVIMLILGSLSLIPVQSQHLIGKKKEEVKAIIKTHYKDFHEDETVKVKRFNYLKYVDNLGKQTWLIFFSTDDICVRTKRMCDYSMLMEEFNELNGKYEKSGKYTWKHSVEDQVLKIELIREDWYFTIVTEQE